MEICGEGNAIIVIETDKLTLILKEKDDGKYNTKKMVEFTPLSTDLFNKALLSKWQSPLANRSIEFSHVLLFIIVEQFALFGQRESFTDSQISRLET